MSTRLWFIKQKHLFKKWNFQLSISDSKRTFSRINPKSLQGCEKTLINRLNFSIKYNLNTNLLLNSIKTRQFSVSSPKNAIPPIVWIFLRPAYKLLAVIAARHLRVELAKLPPEKRKELVRQNFRNHIYKYILLVGGSITALAYSYYSHLNETVITKRKRFILFNSKHLMEIERLALDQILQQNKTKILGLDSKYVNRALRVANRLFISNKEFAGISSIDWKLTVIENEQINAFAFPNGEVFVFSGLLDFIDNDDELSIILAHEMSHAEKMSNERMIDIFSILISGLIWAILPSDLTAYTSQRVAESFLKLTFDLPYSRQLETEADQVGMMIAARACFDVRYSVPFWQRMAELNEEVEEVLSTHPASETRSQDLEKLMPSILQLRKECNCHDLPEQLVISPKKNLNDKNNLKNDEQNFFNRTEQNKPSKEAKK